MKPDNHWYKDNPFQLSDGNKGYYIHDRATRYAMQIIQQSVAAPDKIIKVAERHLDDVDRALQPGANIWWDYGALQKFDKFCFDNCVVPDHSGANEGGIVPLRLLDPFAFAYGLALGWKMNNPKEDPDVDPLRRKHLSRRYRYLFIETPKSSGKTPVSAAYILYHLAGLNPPHGSNTPPLIFVGTDLEKQARVIKDYLHTMISTPQFGPNQLDIEYAREEYYCDKTKGACMFKSAKGFGKGTSGFIPSLVVMEEPQDHDSLELYERLIMGFKSRIEPLTIFNLNAGKRVDCAFWVERQKAGKIAEGVVTSDNYLPIIYGLDARDNPLEGTRQEMEKVWEKVYPTMGVTINKDQIMERVEHAKSSRARKSEVLRLNFGVWTRGISTEWLDFSVIEECFINEMPKNKDWNSLPTAVALDLSRSASLTGFAQGWYLPDDTIVVKADGYTCSEGVKGILDEANYLPIEEWLDMENGGIRIEETITGGRVDYHPIAERLYNISTKQNLIAVGIDSFAKDMFYDALSQYTEEFVKDTDQRPVLGGLRFFEHKNDKRRVKLPLPGSQEEWMYFHDSVERLGNRITNKKIFFLDNPTLAWNFNCMMIQRSGESLVMMKRDAKEARGGRIDLVAAVIYLVGVMEKTIVRKEAHNQQFDEFMKLQPKLAKAFSLSG